MMKEIRLGTIGSGFIVHNILNGVKRTDGIRCVAVYSRTEAKGQQLAGEFGVEKVYTNMDDFLADEEINFVYIATPNLLHYEQTKRALLAGKNVLCEKPFCTREDLAEELFAIAKEKNLILVETAPTVFLPNFQILKRELPKVGPIRLVMSNFSQYSSRYDAFLRGELPNIFNPKLAGGSLMDINFYNVLLNVALFGRPESAVYFPNLADNPKTDTSGVMVMKYPDFISQNAGAKDTKGINFFQIEGEKGYIYAEGASSTLSSIRVVTKDEDITYNEQGEDDIWYHEIQTLTKLLLEDAYDVITGKHQVTLDTIHVMENARKAAGLYYPGDK